MDNTPYSEISEIAVLGTMISFPETIRLYIEKDFPLDVFFSEDNKRVAKNRNGSLKDIDLAFEKNTGKFTDVEYTKYN